MQGPPALVGSDWHAEGKRGQQKFPGSQKNEEKVARERGGDIFHSRVAVGGDDSWGGQDACGSPSPLAAERHRGGVPCISPLLVVYRNCSLARKLASLWSVLGAVRSAAPSRALPRGPKQRPCPAGWR